MVAKHWSHHWWLICRYRIWHKYHIPIVPTKMEKGCCLTPHYLNVVMVCTINYHVLHFSGAFQDRKGATLVYWLMLLLNKSMVQIQSSKLVGSIFLTSTDLGSLQLHKMGSRWFLEHFGHCLWRKDDKEGNCLRHDIMA